MAEPSEKYILLREHTGEELMKNYRPLDLYEIFTSTKVLRGELLEGFFKAGSTVVTVRGIRNELLRLKCPAEDMSRLSEEECNLLLAITSTEERYETWMDRHRLLFARQLLPGSSVFVEVEGISKILPGIVRYRGILPSSFGTWFGVELIGNQGSGESDGSFRNKRYFRCAPDSAVFVGLDKLTPREHKEELKYENTIENIVHLNVSIRSFWQGKEKSSKEIDGVLRIDERVVTVINHSPARGTVRYIGEERGSSGNVDIILGLQLDERLGSGCGELLGFQKFACKRDYAAFVPLTTVIPEKDFRGYRGIAARQEAQEKLEQTHEDEMYLRSMSCVNVPSGKRRQSRDTRGQPPSLREKPRENNEEQKSPLEQLREMKQQVTQLQAQLEEKESEKQKQGDRLQRQLREMEQRLVDEHERLQEKHDQFVNSEARVRKMQGQLQGKDEEIAGLQNQVIELETSLSTAQQLALSERQRQEPPDWVISRDQIQLTDKCLGRGGWGKVVEGKYCGCAVAVKQIHDLILSDHNRSLFVREMNIASRCRHPCLLQFIGATDDEGSPLFVTELMETSLRALLKRPLSVTELFVISLDVARALNYLHQKQPFPIIHRDVSSANVLLWRQGDQWRAKVSDYGTANFMRQTMTVAPGAPIYSAPEAVTKKQTVKVDVYSFGVLLCEMSIQEMPDPEKREQQVALVTNRVIRALIRRCLRTEPEERPCMEEIIDDLEQKA